MLIYGYFYKFFFKEVVVLVFKIKKNIFIIRVLKKFILLFILIYMKKLLIYMKKK